MNSDLRLRPSALKNCNDLRLFSRTLDVEELFMDIPTDDRESLTKFSKFDHQQHDLFVEHHLLSDIEGNCWREVSRWVKYEEYMEDTGNRWGKPRIPALNFHSMVNLRRIMEAGLILLDYDAPDMETITSAIVEHLEAKDLLEPSDLNNVRKTLQLKHIHVEDSEKVWNYLEKEMNPGTSAVEMGGISSFTLEDLKGVRKLSNVIRRIPEMAEGALILSGHDDRLKGLAVAFVRLAEGIWMPGITEIPIQVRFVFLLLGPASCEVNYVEVGRCMGVLLSNSIFRNIAYEARERRDILVGLNEFLDASIVIPHGEWDYEMFHIQELRAREHYIYERKLRRSLEFPTTEGDAEIVGGDDPFKRTRIPFGGVWKDIKRRYPGYWSDIKDGLDIQCLAAGIFLYFACISAACALGAILAKKTDSFIGISENLLGAAVGGIIFAIFGCQPILILATTGPTLVFEAEIFEFCKTMEIENEFLAFRFWTSVWMFFVALIVAAAEGSVLVRFFTRFIQEIFAVFISVVFIWESFNDVTREFGTLTTDQRKTVAESGTFFIHLGLMMSTFTIAMTFRAFKESSFGTKLMRKLLGNFGVFLSIVIMSALAYILTPYNPINNLQLPDAIHDGLRTTRHDNITRIARPSGWFVNPMLLPVNWIFAAAFPGILLFILVFLETSIGELLMGRKEALMQKGTGFHADVLLICGINVLMGILGTNYLSVATLRAVTHLMALAVFSTNNPPGEAPHVIGTKEQRLTALFASLLLGCSTLMGKLLQFVPNSVLYGFFLYMGVTSLKGMQFAERIILFFKQVSNHPEVPYVKQVRTWKMHLYTLIQILSLSAIWGIKVTPAALILPVTFLLLIPLRKFLLVRIFDSTELEALDGTGPSPVVKREPLKVDVTPLSNPMAQSGASSKVSVKKSLSRQSSKR